MTKFYQACYFRLGGNNAAAGWQQLNTSPDMPSTFNDLFTRSAQASQPIELGTPKDVNGNPLCSLQVIGNGTTAGIMRIYYGYADSFGRENMFCHAYLFPDPYELLKDPNRLLALSDSNFHFSPEETAQIPTALSADVSLTPATALAACGMDKNAYVRFISCVYYALSNNANTTIHVRTDGSDAMAKALTYLVYAAIPYSLRAKVTTTTFSGSKPNSMLVFCHSLPGSCMYVDPVTGENNILNTNLEARWKRNPFVTYFAEHYDQIAGQEDQYYQAIEKWLTRMGDPYLRDMDTLRLAFDMLSSQQDQDVAGLLYDWLVLPVPNNDVLEQTVCGLLRKVMEQNISLSRDTEKLLLQRAETALSQELRDLTYRYQAAQLLKMNPDDSCMSLGAMDPGSTTFRSIRAILSATAEGQALLCEFYRRDAERVISDPAVTYSDLAANAANFLDLPGMETVQDRIAKGALQIATAQIQQDRSFFTTVKELAAFFKETPVRVDLDWLRGNLAQVYNDRFRHHFSGALMDEYERFYETYKQYDYFAHSYDLLQKYRAIRGGDFITASQYVEDGCICLKRGPASPEERRTIVQSLLAYALERGAAENCLQVQFWVQMAIGLETDPVTLMIEKQAKLFCDSVTLALALTEDPCWQTPYIQGMADSYRAYAEANPNCPYKKSADALAKELKHRADELKAKEKERARQEKQERKEEAKQQRHGGEVSDPFPVPDPYSAPMESASPAPDKKKKEKEGGFFKLFGKK